MSHNLISEITANNQGSSEVHLKRGCTLAVFVSSGSPRIGRAFLISGNLSDHLKSDRGSLSTWVDGLKNTVNSYHFRLFGNSDTLSILSHILKSAGFTEGKHVSDNDLQSRQFQLLFKEGRIRVLKSGDSPRQHSKTRVLVVDDSETIRKLLTRIINEDPEMECVGAVELPSQVDKAIRELKPDVLTLDIHMPEMDGVTLLKKVLRKNPLPTIMISALSKEDGTFVLDALEAGAVDYIQKPSLADIKVVAPVIREKIKDARFAKVKQENAISHPLRTAQQIIDTSDIDTNYLIAIGSSTGGTEALKVVLTSMPDTIPPIVIVQHIPPVFSKAFAQRMNTLCPFEVKEAEDGDLVTPNRVLIAPGGFQMALRKVGEELRVSIVDAPPMNRHKPSVDYLFDSIAQIRKSKITAAILTGMGGDGARGLLKLRNNGAHTMAQDEASCVVFGMPKEALRLGGAEKAIPLDNIAYELLRTCSLKKRPKSAA